MELSDLVYIDDTGYHYADYPTFLAWRKQQYQDIYGADVYLEADSQDGQLLAIQAKSDYDTAALGAAVFNSFSPVTAQGVGLSRVVKINGLSRQIPTNSTVDLLVVGVAGTSIIGGVAIDTLDQKWDLPDTVIPLSGSITVTATAQELGDIIAEPNTVNKIFTPTLGWQSVNNVAAATPGSPVESDAELRARQAVSTANPSLTVLDGTVGGVANVSGVEKVRGYENDTDSVDANGITAHSICLVVLGGSATDIAEEIALHKTPGTGTFGNTSEIVYDSHDMPLDIKFSRPTSVTITATVTVAAQVGWSSDFEVLIAQAVADAINGNKIGDTVYITKLYPAAYLLGTAAGETFDVASIEIGKNADPQSNVNIPLDFDENAVCDPDVDITIVVT